MATGHVRPRHADGLEAKESAGPDAGPERQAHHDLPVVDALGAERHAVEVADADDSGDPDPENPIREKRNREGECRRRTGGSIAPGR